MVLLLVSLGRQLEGGHEVVVDPVVGGPVGDGGGEDGEQGGALRQGVGSLGALVGDPYLREGGRHVRGRRPGVGRRGRRVPLEVGRLEVLVVLGVREVSGVRELARLVGDARSEAVVVRLVGHDLHPAVRQRHLVLALGQVAGGVLHVPVVVAWEGASAQNACTH
jgi:hypothetical protein